MRRLWSRYLQSFKGLPRDAWRLAFVVLVNRSGSMVLVFMALYLVHELGVSPGKAAATISLYGVGGMAGTLLGGFLSDRFGPKRVQVSSLVANGLLFILLGHVHTLPLIGLVLAATGVVAEAFRPANAAAVGDVCPPDQLTRGYSLNRLAVNVGATIGPAVGGVLVLAGYRFLFWVDGLTCLAAALVLLPVRAAHHAHAEEADVPARSPWRDGPFLAFWLVMLVYGMLFMQLLSTFPVTMDRRFGLPETAIGLLFALNAILCATVEMPLITRLSNTPPLKTAVAGVLFFGAGFSLLPLGSTGGYVALTVVIWTIGEILSFPTFSAMVARRAGPAARGTYMGMFSLAFSTAFVAGPALGGWLYETIGPDRMFAAYLPVSLLMVLVLITAARPMFPAGSASS